MSTTTATGRTLGASGEDAVRGLMICALGYFVISFADASVKWALPEIGVASAMLWRGVIGATMVALLSRGRGLLPVRKGLLAGRSLLHTCVSGSWYLVWGLGVSLADSYAVAAACPLIMTVLAIPMLGEKVGWRRWCSTVVGCTGVLFMLQPGGDLWRWESALLLVATALMALTRIWTRVLARTESPNAVAFWLLVAHIPMGLMLLPVPQLWPASGPPPLLPSWPVIAALVLFGCANGLAHLMFSRAFGLAPIASLAPLEYTPLIWGTAMGFLIWHEVPAWTTLVGAVVVICAGLYNVHRERVRRAQERAAAKAAA